ncbi:MAG: hypothetical protein E5Y74_02830 [Mesorhizobium sp.]|uniref:hypothetical protein n=1 Tax=Mesorhizobium sp. TaxID=1871066 RepID=UPI000FE47F2A|nr:hypothetical protein [Mesorhizobium sp.]RWP86663.1 MAG: hypothetical protein EOR12_21640 [Mesorhizobium sp.]TIM24193.1 MAG: hypothetical protein E5Y74_02830 [Mesorhizobium sp.]
MPLGCEEDLEVDPAGMALAEGGLSAILRYFARFGLLMRSEGLWSGKRLIPASVVRDVQEGDDPAKLESGYSYRRRWWVWHNELGSFEARGIQ